MSSLLDFVWTHTWIQSSELSNSMFIFVKWVMFSFVTHLIEALLRNVLFLERPDV